ncbi:MAG: DUF393 domain-containing protein [Bacteroidales bacterium]
MNNSEPAAPSEVYYDDSCPLCMRAVKFIGNHSGAGEFRFISLQTARENRVPGIAEMEEDSLVAVRNNQLLTGSEAALSIAGKLKFPWNLLRIFLILPSKWRNALYRFVARNRHALYRN